MLRPRQRNPELHYWQAVVRAAEAEFDRATTNSALKLAARRLMRARRDLLALLAQQRAPLTKSPSPPAPASALAS